MCSHFSGQLSSTRSMSCATRKKQSVAHTWSVIHTWLHTRDLPHMTQLSALLFSSFPTLSCFPLRRYGHTQQPAGSLFHTEKQNRVREVWDSWNGFFQTGTEPRLSSECCWNFVQLKGYGPKFHSNFFKNQWMFYIVFFVFKHFSILFHKSHLSGTFGTTHRD